MTAGRALLVAITVAGCGPSVAPRSTPPATAPVADPVAARPTPVAELPTTTMRIEIVRATGLPGAPPWPITELAPDGTITFGGQPIGRLTEDGVASAPDGTPMARLDGDRIVVGDRPTDGTIDEDGTLRNGSADELGVELDGRVHGTHPDAPELRVEPVTPSTRRAAMFVVALGLLIRSDGTVSVGAVARP